MVGMSSDDNVLARSLNVGQSGRGTTVRGCRNEGILLVTGRHFTEQKYICQVPQRFRCAPQVWRSATSCGAHNSKVSNEISLNDTF
jgi:hypothetical protein